MNLQEAVTNVDVVVLNARMTRPEHDALIQSLRLITETCKRTVELEDEVVRLKLVIDDYVDAAKASVDAEKPKEE